MRGIDGCPNDPARDENGVEFPRKEDREKARRAEAKCHICKKWKSCGFCNVCCHWFCDDCRPNIFARAMEAVKELVGMKRPDCCGPDAACHPDEKPVRWGDA